LTLPEWTEELGALLVSLEHRFFREPSTIANVSERYQSLSLENVMSDVVNFINYIKHTVPGTTNSTVIVFGGSYRDFLMMAMEMNHPEVLSTETMTWYTCLYW
jgi:hypothetical protein